MTGSCTGQTVSRRQSQIISKIINEGRDNDLAYHGAILGLI